MPPPLPGLSSPTRRGVLAGLCLPLAAEQPASLGRLVEGDRRTSIAGLETAAFGKTRPVRLAQAFGRAHLDPDRALRADSPLRVASISKLVTAIGVMRLVERGRIGLLDDVSDHLGFRLRHPLFPATPITLRSLLSHTSGLRNGPSYPVPFGRPLREAFEPTGRHWDQAGWFSPAGEPPGYYAYADVNFALVAQLIERVSGERFDRYMTREVFAPVRLDCGFNWSGVSQSARDRAATLYRRGADDAHWAPDGPWIAQVDGAVPPAPDVLCVRAPEAAGRPLDSYAPGENGFVFAPQGGLRASVLDLSRIGRLLARGGAADGVRLMTPASAVLMRTPVWRRLRADDATLYGGGQIRAYGLGTVVLTGATGADGDALFLGCAGWVGHLGEAYGLYSGLWWDPATGRGFAYAITGVPGPASVSPGARSAYTGWEEQIAGTLSRA